MHSRVDAPTGTVGNRASLVAYSGARFLDAAGLTILALDMAEVTNLAGGANGALLTGVVLAACPLVSAMTVPMVPKVTRRLGIRRTLALAVTATVASNVLAAIGLFAGLPALAIVIGLAVVLGVWEAVFYALGPIVNRAYFGLEMAQAFSRTRILVVLGFAIAGLSAGLIVLPGSPGYGVVAAALLTAPLAVVLWLAKPTQEPARPNSVRMPISAHIDLVRNNPAFRGALLIAVVTALFIAPVTTMIIPITDSLHQVSVVTGAGAILASQALGSLAAPKLIQLWTKPPHGSNLRAAIIGTVVVGIAMILFGVADSVLSSSVELLVWVLIGFAFGAGFGVCSSSGIGAAVDSVSPSQSVEAVASRSFVVLVCLPVGLIVWGGLLSFTSIQVALAVGALGLIALAFTLRPTLQSGRAKQAARMEQGGEV